MRTRLMHAVFAMLLGTLLYPFGGSAVAQVPADVPDDPDAAFEPLLRGPVHEAFAELYTTDPQSTIVVPKAPPEPIEEIPPEVRPEGEMVVWIPGYWGWDDGRDDFIWISGVWRKPPPDQRWVPGYWTQTTAGWQWIAGTWMSAEVNELQYLPEPPATLEQGAMMDAPSDDHFWVPGMWRYQVDRYVWRPGYWSLGHADWVWMPARYVWTPRGCIYVGGYWDYPLAYRGYLFAPVFFNRPVFLNPGFFYTPTVFVQPGLLFNHFWVRPGYCHYYFGDFYGGGYAGMGIYPWFRYPQLRGGFYDPLFAWQRMRHGPQWNTWWGGMSRNYDWYAANQRWRPPHTWRDQVVVQNQFNVDARQFTDININNNINNIFLGRSVRDVVDRRESGFVRLDQSQREQYRGQWDSVRNLSQERRRIESTAWADAGGGRGQDGRPDGRGSGQDWQRGESRGQFRLPDADPGVIARGDRSRGRGGEASRQAQQILGRDAAGAGRDIGRQFGQQRADVERGRTDRGAFEGGEVGRPGPTADAFRSRPTPQAVPGVGRSLGGQTADGRTLDGRGAEGRRADGRGMEDRARVIPDRAGAAGQRGGTVLDALRAQQGQRDLTPGQARQFGSQAGDRQQRPAQDALRQALPQQRSADRPAGSPQWQQQATPRTQPRAGVRGQPSVVPQAQPGAAVRQTLPGAAARQVQPGAAARQSPDTFRNMLPDRGRSQPSQALPGIGGQGGSPAISPRTNVPSASWQRPTVTPRVDTPRAAAPRQSVMPQRIGPNVSAQQRPAFTPRVEAPRAASPRPSVAPQTVRPNISARQRPSVAPQTSAPAMRSAPAVRSAPTVRAAPSLPSGGSSPSIGRSGGGSPRPTISSSPRGGGGGSAIRSGSPGRGASESREGGGRGRGR